MLAGGLWLFTFPRPLAGSIISAFAFDHYAAHPGAAPSRLYSLSTTGWVDTLLPLIVPQFFANAYDVFLLRQFFMTIPLELDDAAKIDGANPLQILLYIILPQARPALVSVGIFHFLYAWNDFYEPLIFLHTPRKLDSGRGLANLRRDFIPSIRISSWLSLC